MQLETTKMQALYPEPNSKMSSHGLTVDDGKPGFSGLRVPELAGETNVGAGGASCLTKEKHTRCLTTPGSTREAGIQSAKGKHSTHVHPNP